MTAQDPFDVAVIIPTLLRPELVRAVESVFRQDIKGRVQILIGIDVALGGASGLQAQQALQARRQAKAPDRRWRLKCEASPSALRRFRRSTIATGQND